MAWRRESKFLGASVGDKRGGAFLTKTCIEAVEIVVAKSVAGALLWSQGGSRSPAPSWAAVGWAVASSQEAA